MDHEKLKHMLTHHEGARKFPYTDTVGKVSIGVGRNLTDKGISPSEMAILLENDINDALKDLDANLPWWRTLSEARQLVLADLCFNMGIRKLLAFKKTLGHVQAGQFKEAGAELLNSKYAKQVGARAVTLKNILVTGLYKVPFKDPA
jgi:lysozyme